MAFQRISQLFVGALLSVSASIALAGPIVRDVSPLTTAATIGSNNYTNMLGNQHFAEKVSFSVDTFITGMDIYMATSFAQLNDLATVSIWKNKANAPGAVLSTFSTKVTKIDNAGATAGNHRVHVDFGGFTMLASEAYWIGMAANSAVWTQTSLRGIHGGSNSMAMFNGTHYSGMVSVGDMAYRLSTSNSVPEPTSVALFGLGLAGFAIARRRRQK